MELLVWIEESGLFTWVNESGSLWGYPTILFLHTFGLAVVAGINACIDLRVLGMAPKVPLSAFSGIFPLIWTAFGVTAASGTTLLLADAVTKLSSPVFYVKLLFIVLALANMQLLRRRVFANPHLDTAPLTANARVLAATSLLWWIAATTAGRLMAYLGPA